MHISMLNYLFFISNIVSVRFRHRFFILVKASWLIHVIPNLNTVICPYIRFLLNIMAYFFNCRYPIVELFNIFSCIRIHKINPYWWTRPTPGYMRLNVILFLHKQTIFDNFLINEIVFILFYMWIDYSY